MRDALIVIITALIIFVPQVALAEENESAKLTPEEAAAKSITNTAFKLYASIDKGNENTVFSPLGLTACLAMAYAGADGNTAEELRKTLDIVNDSESYFEFFKQITANLKDYAEPDSKRNLANAIWIQRGFIFVPGFSGILENCFDAKCMTVDFKESPEKAAESINKWCSFNTGGKITSGIDSKSITPLHRMILTNALYFKDNWRYKFPGKLTKKDLFHISGKETVQTEMMCMEKGLCLYMNESDLSGVCLEYQNGLFCILMPSDVDGIGALEKNLSAKKFDSWFEKFRYANIKKAVVPKFQVSTIIDVKNGAGALSIKEAFSSEKANFKKISREKDLYISNMIQQSVISIDENGTEVASFTAMGMTLLGGPPPMPDEEIVFIADHPFIFFIIDYSSGQRIILFMGRVVNPNKK